MKKKKAIPASQLEQKSHEFRERVEQVVKVSEEREPDSEEAASEGQAEEASFEDIPWKGAAEADEGPIARETVEEEEVQVETGPPDPRVDLILNMVDELLGGVICRWDRIEQIVMRVVELVIRVYLLQANVLRTLETGETPVDSIKLDDETKANLLGMLDSLLEGLEKTTP